MGAADAQALTILELDAHATRWLPVARWTEGQWFRQLEQHVFTRACRLHRWSPDQCWPAGLPAVRGPAARAGGDPRSGGDRAGALALGALGLTAAGADPSGCGAPPAAAGFDDAGEGNAAE